MKNVKVALAALAAAATVAIAPAANAAPVLISNNGPNGFYTALLGNNDPAAGSFADDFSFTLPGVGLLSLSLTDIAFEATNNVEFLGAFLNGSSVNLGNVSSAFGGEPDNINFAGIPVSGGLNTLRITGTNGGNGAYGGSLSFRPTAAVPEPATWAMMILGMGAVGYSMRRRGSNRRRLQAV